ncbi:MAG: polyphenol oxidase family protein [Deferrisomatales bacterium]|nr:polyphenol oxidase family protein [Deferrisomatales bacterium]
MGQAYPMGALPENPRWVQSALLRHVDGLIHGFTTRRAGDFSARGPVQRLLRATGARRLRLLRQVHGTKVVPCGGERRRGPRPRADAWAGRPAPGVLVGVLTADCAPVLLCHPSSGIVGLAHAGWRGAVAGVARATVQAMGVPAREVRAAIGPAIGPCCYQVGAEVVEALGGGSEHLGPWPGEPGRRRLDLPGLVRSDLLDAGLEARAVEVLPLCTACSGEILYSYRREGATGRLCAFLGWNRYPANP